MQAGSIHYPFTPEDFSALIQKKGRMAPFSDIPWSAGPRGAGPPSLYFADAASIAASAVMFTSRRTVAVGVMM